MAWQLEGTYFETCSCNVVCPCTASFALGADNDYCRVTLVFNIVDGEVRGLVVGRGAVDGSELTIAKTTRSRIDAFGVQFEGNAAMSTSKFAWAA